MNRRGKGGGRKERGREGKREGRKELDYPLPKITT